MLGLRLDDLGTRALSWRDLWVVVHQAPTSSALYRSVNPEAYGWGLAEQLQAAGVDALRWLVWAKTKDGAAGRNRPQPIPRPGVTPPREVTRHGGNAGLPIEQMADWLGWDRTHDEGGMRRGR